ncbi:MAG: hypothetical protein C4297_05190 [Gemmataceae bacterium]
MLLWAYLLIILGLLLLVAEVFIPSGGLLFVLSVVALVSGITMIFYAPESEGGGTVTGIVTLIGIFVLIPIVVITAFHYWPKTPFGKKFFLEEPGPGSTIAQMPELAGREHLRGQIAKTVTPLRPCGVITLHGQRLEAQAEGMFIDSGQLVRIVDVRVGQITVRPLDDKEISQLPEDLLS